MEIDLMPFTFVSSGLSDVGLVRENNEDAWGEIEEHNFYTLADGMGGHQAGEIAAREAVSHLLRLVRKGFKSAKKKSLPDQFVDVIKEHHGTTLVYYFYHKQIELSGGDKNAVEDAKFRYSGPKPRTKESTIIMIADTLEAASRSLDQFNETTITELVESLVAQKLEDNQFDDSLLTFEELGVVKRVIIKNLLAASHPRVKYPPHHPGEEG